MPTLTWVGKDKVVNHHHDVPFRILNKQYNFTANNNSPINSTQNRIIQGDNLEALKSLLPEFEGKVKCIYIDPPYNTGNEGWVYNDNVNDPKMKKWLGQVVGKEGEDLSRHDKWLCMMYPRLKLLHKLLADDGVIFVSIGDDEHASLKLLMDEIFGRDEYLSSLVWRRRASSQLELRNLSVDHEYVVTYAKNGFLGFNGHQKLETGYANPDNDPRGLWTLGDLTVGMTKDQRPNQFFDLLDPISGRIFKPNPNRVWCFYPETMAQKIAEGRVVFPKSDNARPMLKRFFDELRSATNPLSSYLSGGDNKIGLTSEGTKCLQEIFDGKVFDYPKPLSLLEVLFSQVNIKDGIFLDSFAGSGTTAHAVLKLNAQDGGNRRFILVEMMDYAENITAERVRRVINGYGQDNKTVTGLGGGFDYYTIGEPLFLANDNLNEAVGINAIRDYITYSEGIPTHEQTSPDNPYNPYVLGVNREVAWIFFYETERVTTLDIEFLGTLQFGKHKPVSVIIYADKCLLSPEFMRKHNIRFKKIPRDITRF